MRTSFCARLFWEKHLLFKFCFLQNLNVIQIPQAHLQQHSSPSSHCTRLLTLPNIYAFSATKTGLFLSKGVFLFEQRLWMLWIQGIQDPVQTESLWVCFLYEHILLHFGTRTTRDPADQNVWETTDHFLRNSLFSLIFESESFSSVHALVEHLQTCCCLLIFVF